MAARRGDEDAFRRLVEPHRTALYAHCYRMLGSSHDAEDALQDALIRAWRALTRFDGRSAFRTWLYRIATNACLNALARRPKRVLSLDEGHLRLPGTDRPPADVAEVARTSNEALRIEAGYASPEDRYEQREAVELAFAAAIKHLPSRQRAVLILRDVLRFTAGEVAEALGSTVPGVNSALQRARKVVDERAPDRNEQATVSSLADEQTREIVQRFTDAFERGDASSLVALLAEDARRPPNGRRGVVEPRVERCSAAPTYG